MSKEQPVRGSLAVMQTGKKQSNKASKSRSRLRSKVLQYKKDFPPGDITLFVNVPAHKQGQITFIHDGLTAEQSEDVLGSIQKGIIKAQKNPDPRLARLQKLVSKSRAAQAQEAVAGSQLTVSLGKPEACD